MVKIDYALRINDNRRVNASLIIDETYRVDSYRWITQSIKLYRVSNPTFIESCNFLIINSTRPNHKIDKNRF